MIDEINETPGAWPDRAIICHPAPNGKGSALRLELHPARGRVPGYVYLEIARQRTAESAEGEVRTFATFDWPGKIAVKLGLDEIAEMIMIFRGMRESIQDGRGVFIRTARESCVFKFSHVIEPRPGYFLQLDRKPHDGEPESAYFVFRIAEAVWLSCALEASMNLLVFGVPRAAEA